MYAFRANVRYTGREGLAPDKETLKQSLRHADTDRQEGKEIERKAE